MHARLLTLVMLCAVSVPGAQERQDSAEPQTPTFITGTHYVRVDLYVTRDGALVDDLRLGDVEVYEDGVQQQITAFERITVRPFDRLEPGVEPRTLEESRTMAGDARSRVFVIFLETRDPASFFSDRSQLTFPLLRMLRESLGPDDLVAVMTPYMRPQDITFGRGVAALDRIPDKVFSTPIRDPKEDLYQACYPRTPMGSPAGAMIARRREKLTFDAIDGLVAHLGELREERKAVLLITDGWSVVTDDLDLIRPRETPRIPGPPIGGLGGVIGAITERGVITLSEAEWTECERDRIALAMLDHSERLREMAARANAHNVSFYPISRARLRTELPIPGVIPSVTAPAENTSRLARHAALRLLAAETDGVAVLNTNIIEPAVKRAIADTSAYYLLGYTSTNPARDGRYRRIEVGVNRPGVGVRARPGYMGPTEAELRDPAGAGDAPRLLDPVAAAFGRMAAVDLGGPLRVRNAVWVPAAAAQTGGGIAWVVGEIDGQVRRQAGHNEEVTVELAVTASDGSRVLTRQTTIAPGDAAFALRLPESGALPAGSYTALVRLHGGGIAEVVTTPVVVPADGSLLGEPLVLRRGPATGARYVPTADPRARRSERLRVELPTESDVPATARLLDRRGAPLLVPLEIRARTDAADHVRWITVEMALAPLAPGEYAIEVAQDESRRVIPFRIVP